MLFLSVLGFLDYRTKQRLATSVIADFAFVSLERVAIAVIAIPATTNTTLRIILLPAN
jgi:hypothetical protein